jgi:hypothetical protein
MASSDTRKCARCGIEKPVDEFGFKYRERGIRQSWCKPCYVEYKRLWYLQNREEHLAHVKKMRAISSEENQRLMWQYLACHPCVDCGERDPVVLQFDHLRDKRCDVSAMARSGFIWETIFAEIAKCEVRCANCHMARTAKELGIWERKHMTLHMPSIWETDRIHNCAYGPLAQLDRAPAF